MFTVALASALIVAALLGALWGWASVAAAASAPVSAPAAPGVSGAPSVSDSGTAATPASAAASVSAPVNRPPPQVPQPIDFPHWRHAGQRAEGGMEINCLYCHSYARRSTVAGIPPLAKCMGCHKHIATDKPQIVKLTGYWQRGEPVPW